MRLGAEELLGPWGTLLDKFKDLGNIVERFNRQQLEIVISQEIHARDRNEMS